MPGKSLADTAGVYGRPDWFTVEPTSGGAILGWNRLSALGVHMNADGVCDGVLRRSPNELDLSWRFRTLGLLRGQPIVHVEAWVGLPNANSQGYGYSLLQWQRPGYHVALKFDPDGYLLGITSNYIGNPTRV